MSKLTAIQIRNAKPKACAYKLSDGHGMYLHVAPSGLKTWRYRFKVNGKESTFTLGEYPLLSLEQARLARMQSREQVREGENPVHLRKEKKQQKNKELLEVELAKINIFKNIALEWVDIQRSAWTKDHADAVLNTLQLNAFPKIGNTL